MENTNNLSTFKVINEDIKAVLRDLDERLSEHPHFNSQDMNENSEAFLEILDKLLEARSSIEATSAGAAGRGFAVVASEVRKLATRSAEAANQIKELSVLANRKSTDGISISREMIGGFETLNSKISMTTDIVERVSRASNDQMNVIEQINQAIGELNEATQENSLIIEKTDSVAEEVAFLSNKLVEDANSKQFIGKA